VETAFHSYDESFFQVLNAIDEEELLFYVHVI
jgi:hypothetical protein